MGCVSVTAYRPCRECQDEATCGIRHAMKRVRDSTASILDGTMLMDVNHQTATMVRIEQTRRSNKLTK